MNLTSRRQGATAAPEIHHYLALRREGKLPKKPEGFEDVYLVARSFAGFIDSLQPYNEAAET